MASDDIMTAGAGGATATVRADIKAAFFDIDGTLTSFVTHVIPQSSIDALHELQDRGVKVFICSGRAPSHMTVVLDMMPVHFDGIIALNGQYCFDDHGLLEKESLLPEDIVTITRWLDEHPDVVANYCEKDYVYFNQITDAMQATWRQLGKTAPTVNIDDPHERALKYETFQISPYISFEDEAKLSGMCRNVRGVRWHPDFTDLIPADGGKPEGMKRFMRHYGWTREQTIAFGDGGNDADMLAFAGIGVAMGNATEPAKAAADYITDDVDRRRHHERAQALQRPVAPSPPAGGRWRAAPEGGSKPGTHTKSPDPTRVQELPHVYRSVGFELPPRLLHHFDGHDAGGSSGASERSVGTASSLSTTALDSSSATSPKIVWCPSSHGVGTVVMKNWEPLVPCALPSRPRRRPAFAMASRYGRSNVSSGTISSSKS